MTNPFTLLRQLDEGLTAGPWKAVAHPIKDDMSMVVTSEPSDIVGLFSRDDVDEAAAIATLRNALPEIVAVLGVLTDNLGDHGWLPHANQARIDAALSALTEKLDV